MALVPLSYNLRSLWQRRSATLLTMLGVAATVAVLSGVLALQQGFATLFTNNAREGVFIVVRKGALSEGESAFTRADARILQNSRAEVATDSDGRALAAAEVFLGVLRDLIAGGQTIVPIRGVQPTSFAIAGDRLKIIEGRPFAQGSDEVIVGRRLVGRIKDSKVGDVVQLNRVPCRVVGVFACEGPFESEIWGDAERMMEALDKSTFNRIVLRLKPGVDGDRFKQAIAVDTQTPADVLTEAEYMEKQTVVMSSILGILGQLLAIVMGIAAVFTATNTMLAAIASRSHEIGILLSVGFRPVPIFFSFLGEAILLCLIGGIIGCVLVLPINGVETGAANFVSFTDVAFAFRVTPTVMVTAVVFATLLGLIGGAMPAWRAARMRPTQALRRQ